jgi:phytoene desaturase
MKATSENALVVGAGFGGISAALRLRAKGYEVTLVEAGSQAGGRGRVFRRDGFFFDAGPTVITAPYLFEELFGLFGKKMEDYVQMVPVDPFYRIEFDDGTRFDYVGEEEALVEEIRRVNPADVDGYRRLLSVTQDIFGVGYEELADADFSSLTKMFSVVPDMVRLGSYRSVYGMVSKFIEDERLRQVFTFQPLLIGGNPFRAPSIYLLIHWLERKWGVHFAMGGTGALVRGLVQLMEEEGIEICFNSPVDQILVSDGRCHGVRVEGGEERRADLVVCNADPSMVYTRLIDPGARKRHSDRAVGRKRQSMSLFVGYFGTDKVYDDLAHHTIVLGPRYKELLTDIFERKVLAEDFSLYLHAPARTDPAMAPPGQDAFYVLSPVPNQRSGIDWESTSEAYFDRILERLEQRVMPGLTKHVTTRFAVDPRYFEEELRSVDGAAFGLEPVLHQSAYFRYHNKCPDIRGLYFVGAGTHPGAGLPGVLCSARVLDRLIPRPQRHQRPASGIGQVAV